jgi:SAM-dependent methyltransferase
VNANLAARVSDRQPALSNLEMAVRAALEHTATYALDPAFRRSWLGFTPESRNWHAQQLRAFGELVGSVTDSLAEWRVLDVGCGDGHWLRTYLEFDATPARLVGIDVSDARFAIGRSKNPLIELIQSDGMSIPFPDEQFELVTQWVCFSSIPTHELRSRIAAEISRVVRRGGFVYWWDLLETVAPSDSGVPIHPRDYFDWPMRLLPVGVLPLPSESLVRIRRLASLLLDRFTYRPSHLAALVGPKP